MDWIVVVVAALIGAGVGWWTPELAQRSTSLQVPERRPLYAVTGGLACALTAWSIGAHWLLIAWLIIVCAGVVLSAIDVAHHRLPDRLVLPLYPVIAVALLLPALQAGTFSFYIRALIAMVAMFAVYFILALIYPAGMGMGDVKLAGVLGLGLGYLGWDYVFIGFMAAFVLGSIVGVGLILFGNAGRKTAIAFGPFMFAGAVVTLVVAAVI